MDKAAIASAMSKVVGDPSSGMLHDAIPGMAEAVYELLSGNKADSKGQASTAPGKAEQRVVKADETR
jgi:hypothetical protein